ncbi:HEAT repeat domain-containing protein [Bradyrhizobium sp. Arg62]|nr:HEAT repeat domain-containing protein [Bradyrhizobium ivorense]MCC8951066.1 HEAT repeat domain-containing protein [Bradyrhizobium brasilense]
MVRWSAVDQQVTMVHSADGLPSKDAAAALGEIADSSARDALVGRARDDDPDVRKTVRWALQQIEARANP